MQSTAIYKAPPTSAHPITTTNWNTLAKIFDAESSEAVDPRAADNILIAWPELIRMLERLPCCGGNAHILDFGCGTGAFARKLANCGHAVHGVDPADQMIAIAKRQSEDIQFTVGSVDQILPNQMFDAITAIMVFQFIDDKAIEELFAKLVSHLKPNGRLIFAVHNKAYFDYAKSKTEKYYESQTGQFFIRFKEHGSIQLHPRSPSDYSRILELLGMNKLAESTPAFTDEYIATYGSKANEPLDLPKFLIMSFAKSS